MAGIEDAATSTQAIAAIPAVPLNEHWKVVHDLTEKFSEERDRRYTEVGVEREKALKIKETADLAALGLAREIQTYKDEKANQLREQINSERGLYVTNDKFDVALKAINEFISAQQGAKQGSVDMRSMIVALVGVAALAVAVISLATR